MGLIKMDNFDLWLLSLAQLACFDNEGGDNGGGAGDDGGAAGGDEGAAAAAAAAGATDQKIFHLTQTELNEYLAKNKRGLQDKVATLETSYKQLLENRNLAEQTREELQAQLEDFQAKWRTKDQQIEFEKKKAAEKYENELKSAKEAADKYERLFTEGTIERAIKDAASKHDGFKGDGYNQFVAVLRPKTKMVEEVDDAGHRTGRFVPQVEVYVKNEVSGQQERQLKTPDEAVLDMKNNPEQYGNMFTLNVVRGIGEGTAIGNTPIQGKVDPSRIKIDDFMKLRKEEAGRKALGLTR